MPKAFLDLAVPFITFILLIVVGSDLRPDDFRRVLRQPRLVAAGLLLPLLVLPLTAIALIALFRPPFPIAAGLLLIAACPVGGISNTYSYLARASTALSVTLTALSCVLAVVTIPAIGTLFGHVLQRSLVAEVQLPRLLAQLLATVVLPVSLGMVARHRWPDLTDRRRPSLQRVGFVLLGLLLVMIVLADARGFVAALPQTVPLAAAFVACSFLVGGGVGHALGAEMRDRLTLAIEFATRNVAVATTLAVTMLGHVEFAAFATTYFLTELPLMIGAVVVFRRMILRTDVPAAQEPSLENP